MPVCPDTSDPASESIPFYQVRVYAVPRNDWSSQALNSALQAWLSDRTLTDRDVVVLGPNLSSVNITINLVTYAGFDPNSVKLLVVQAVQNYFIITDTSDIQIGATFYSSRLASIVQQIPGVSSIVMTVNVVGQAPSPNITPAYNEIIQLSSLSVVLPSS